MKDASHAGSILLFFRQFSSPITLILLSAAILSLFLHDATDAVIILSIVLVSGMLGFWHERGAGRAVQRLLAEVEIKSRVMRGGAEIQLPLEAIVPGDVVLLSGGSVVPADCRLLEAVDLHVNEAALTGETFRKRSRVTFLRRLP